MLTGRLFYEKKITKIVLKALNDKNEVYQKIENTKYRIVLK